MQIRPIGPQDFDAFWPVRLQGLRECPRAFGASYEESLALPREQAIVRLSPPDGGFILGAFADGENQADKLVGVVGFVRNGGLKSRHKGLIWGVYVVPEARGVGLARKLLETAIARCREVAGVEDILLTVGADNAAALAL
jgi:ribosomal protein S18 acetylase RimI-like enzyme